MKTGTWIYVMFPLGSILFFLAAILHGITLIMNKPAQGLETSDIMYLFYLIVLAVVSLLVGVVLKRRRAKTAEGKSA